MKRSAYGYSSLVNIISSDFRQQKRIVYEILPIISRLWVKVFAVYAKRLPAHPNQQFGMNGKSRHFVERINWC